MIEPREPLSLTIHSVPEPQLVAEDMSLSVRRRGRLKMLLVLLVCAAPVVASYLTYYVIRPTSAANYGTLIEPPRPLPSLSLRDLKGMPIESQTLKQQWLLLVATKSACDAGCEHLLYLQRQLREMLGRDRERVDRVWLLLDEGMPSPKLLDGVRATPGIVVAHARRDELQRWLAPDSGHGIEDHLYVVDPRGDLMMRMPASPDPAKVRRDLDRLLRASASWDLPGR